MTTTLDSLLILLTSLHGTTDPAFAEALWTATACILLMMAGVLAMAMLPWTDHEIDRVDPNFFLQKNFATSNKSARQRKDCGEGTVCSISDGPPQKWGAQ